MLITDDIFQAFLQCETKAHLKLAGAVGDQQELPEWERHLVEDYKRQCYRQWRAEFGEAACLVGIAFPHDLDNSRCRLVMDCTVQAREMQAHLYAVERVAAPDKPHDSPYMPIRCVPREKITTQDKLLLAFDALALGTVSGHVPRFGKIVHGCEQVTAKVEVVGLLDLVKTVVGKIAAQHAHHTPPPLMLNPHCAACEFKARCRHVAVEKDDLSLLSGMTAKEMQKQHSKGIFSVTQLSYTFRARRKPKRFASTPEKYSHALRALALREGKIYITGKPELKLQGTPVYLDVEGVPDRNFYYLIGLRVKSGEAYVQHAFWANALSEEQAIWAAFLQTLAQIDHPQLIHYGSYETTFLQRMQTRYRAAVEPPAFLDQLIAASVNVLSVIYAQIYFPTYSNGLKEIAHYLGFQWSESEASGLHTLLWRSQWECSKDAGLKQKLVTYNAEDCEALERVTSTIAQLWQRQTEVAKAKEGNIVYTDSLKHEDSHHFGNKEFSMPELKYINQAAYWDYQRDKIYIRSNPRLKHISRKIAKGRSKVLPVNKIVECPAPSCCPKCKTKKILKLDRTSKIVHDLKFSRAGIKRWIVKYSFDRYLCRKCGISFYFQQIPRARSPFGSELVNYVIYQIIELRLPQETIAQSLNQLFDFHLGHSAVNRQKERAARFYAGTYEGILKRIVTGKLIHADETKISIAGKDAFVWVFTNLEEVAYYYTKTREGDFLQELLREFKGVLVSDFYTAYDSINCPQQKCLIHFLRDLNDDLLKQPFNEELKELVRDFAALLKPMIETIDQYGLKAHFLRKHKVFVERFYKELFNRDYQSEKAIY